MTIVGGCFNLSFIHYSNYAYDNRILVFTAYFRVVLTHLFISVNNYFCTLSVFYVIRLLFWSAEQSREQHLE